MVVKLKKILMFVIVRFESRVILDGSQTQLSNSGFALLFESRVILDGSQT